jgi:hypothetical protein
MKRTIFWHALNCLTHPVSILALLVLGLNDLILQVYWPSWWTGKLGDAAWMIFAPFLMVSVVIWLLPRKQSQNAFRFSFFMVCAGFLLVKSVPGINFAIHDLARLFGLSLKLRLDPTDLGVLPLAWVSWQIWNQKFVLIPCKSRALAGFALALVVTLADAAPPPSNCMLILEDNSIVVEATHSQYRSQDGGITWTQDTTIDEERLSCTYMTWPVTLDTDPPVAFYYSHTEGLYQTVDRGKTLTQIHLPPDETTYVDYAIATPLDTLVLSTGNANFWTRLPNGEWLHFEEKYPELLLEQVAD